MAFLNCLCYQILIMIIDYSVELYYLSIIFYLFFVNYFEDCCHATMAFYGSSFYKSNESNVRRINDEIF